ncbi:MAG: hypothetical protein KF889_25975 [Alphaproteobacteria bacterium]|nr:hypothetical protein [Alphaproteobacteria bacterium]MCW5739556.1 hypothetical protein [Alphaproteobacteria bacterium]
MSEFLPWLGNTPWSWLLTLVLLALPATLITGRSVAITWQPGWQVVLYSAMLAATHRFADYALSNGELWAPIGFALAWAILAIAGLAMHRATRAAMMVAQYPWLHQRDGLFGWRDKPGG